MVDGARQALRRHRAVILVAPTGSGKTQLAAAMIKGAVERGGRPWFVMHRDFLLDQTSQTLQRVGVDHGFIAAGRPFNPYIPAQVCSIQTLGKRLERVPPQCAPTIVFLDEAHHSAAGTWAALIRHYERAKVVGLSATPERLDGKPLGAFYGDMVRGPTVAWLIENGYLSDYRAFAPSAPDLAGVHTRAGDFANDELDAVMDTPKLTGDAVSHYLRVARGKRAIYFCVSIHHSQHVAAAFRAAGVPAAHIDGTTPTVERAAAARAMARGELQVLVNVEIFGEGFDLSAQAGADVPIECVGLLRPTKSLALYMQQVGRALRPKPEPAIILDHAGNLMAHGLPDLEREWSLDGVDRKKRQTESAGPSPRTCTGCFATFPAFKMACPECGKPVEREAREIETVDGELEEVDKAALRRAR